MTGFIYLASPYTHLKREVMETRYLAVMRQVNMMLRAKVWVYSPVLHCHELALRYGHSGDFEYWRDYDLAMIDASKKLCVLQLKGWEQSVGVREEVEHAKATRKEVEYLKESV